ncbi:hypothetical protein STHU_32480 [Allostella humosa]|nr:hypothetical protein STHU_32480 [Stella humosa]
MTVASRSWIVPMSMAILLTGCGTVDRVTDMFGSSKPSETRSGGGKSFVGERAVALDGDLERLRATQKERAEATARLKGAAQAETAAYNGTVQEIAERLQAGSGPLNPQLLNQWTEARSHLARVDETVSRMRALDADLTADRARGRFLAETGRSLAGVGGATEAEAARVRDLQAGLAATAAALDATGNELAAEIRTQTEWLATERRRSDTLLAAVRTGLRHPRRARRRPCRPLPFAAPSASAAAPAPAAPVPGIAPAPAVAAPAPAVAPLAAAPAPVASFRPTSVDGRRPFVAIRFGREEPDYERALYDALRVAVERDPAIRFDVVAVVPRDGRGDAKRAAANATKVARSMRAMGLSEDQTRTYERPQGGISDPQVHVYIRRR